MKPQFKIALAAALALASSCGGGGRVKSTSLPGSDAGRLAIGYLENRHGGYRVFPVKNFLDSLEFEFMEKGYEILDYSPDLLNEVAKEKKAEKPETKKPADTPPALNEKTDPLLADPESFLSRSDVTDNLFPEKLRAIAGERGATRHSVRTRERTLTGEEIKKLAGTLGFDYFVQGAVGTTERNFFGAAFDEEEDSLIFLKIYDREGRRVGAIRFTVDEEDYSRASFLTDIARRIVENFVQSTFARSPAKSPPENPDGETRAPAPPPADPDNPAV